MKVVNPQNTIHLFVFLPRYDTYSSLELLLKNEATNAEFNVPITETVNLQNDLVRIQFNFTFVERDKFQIKIIDFDEQVIYRGKLFATVQETQDFKITEGFITY